MSASSDGPGLEDFIQLRFIIQLEHDNAMATCSALWLVLDVDERTSGRFRVPD
jgi:hypothetical protein